MQRVALRRPEIDRRGLSFALCRVRVRGEKKPISGGWAGEENGEKWSVRGSRFRFATFGQVYSQTTEGLSTGCLALAGSRCGITRRDHIEAVTRSEQTWLGLGVWRRGDRSANRWLIGARRTAAQERTTGRDPRDFTDHGSTRERLVTGVRDSTALQLWDRPEGGLPRKVRGFSERVARSCRSANAGSGRPRVRGTCDRARSAL